MHNDNPLWYDYAEPDEAPSRTLLLIANCSDVALSGMNAVVRAYLLPDQIWCRAADAFARCRTMGARRS